MNMHRFPRTAAILTLMASFSLATVSAGPYYYGGRGWGGWGGGYYRGGYCYGNGGWYGTGIPNGLGWTMFGLGVAGAAAAVASPYVAPPVYAVPAAPYYPATTVYQPPQAIAVEQPAPAAPANPPSDTLTKVQTKLAGLGYFKGTVDGYYGPQTARAVEQFQIDNSLPVNGRLDLKTLSSLGIEP